VLRAALQHDDTRPDRWSTFKTLARANVADATPILLAAMGPGNKAAKTRAIAFGFQVVLGTLVNAILNDPGPLSIHDREMEERLAGCLLLLLQAEMTASRPACQRATGADAGSELLTADRSRKRQRPPAKMALFHACQGPDQASRTTPTPAR
jgi:hypothetical protein